MYNVSVSSGRWENEAAYVAWDLLNKSGLISRQSNDEFAGLPLGEAKLRFMEVCMKLAIAHKSKSDINSPMKLLLLSLAWRDFIENKSKTNMFVRNFSTHRFGHLSGPSAAYLWEEKLGPLVGKRHPASVTENKKEFIQSVRSRMTQAAP